ncbi:TetR/AcrR family transcriptional regulator [Acidothermaceae bacterium B102]|nr:TetR/AcrR family transcriptional regulator [Acidothermaceae bacterium B102]
MGKAALRGVVRAVKSKTSSPATADDCFIGSTRRRGPDLENAILDATLDLLAESGVGGVTMEGVAAAAKTGKASVYRRWPSKEDLLVDAMRHALPPLDAAPDTGSVRDDLVALLVIMLEVINSKRGCAIQAFMFDNSVDKALMQVIKSRAMEPRHQMLVDVLARGRDRGEVRPDAVNAQTAEVGPALIVHQYLMHGPPVPDAFVVQLVDTVLMPLLRP